MKKILLLTALLGAVAFGLFAQSSTDTAGGGSTTPTLTLPYTSGTGVTFTTNNGVITISSTASGGGGVTNISPRMVIVTPDTNTVASLISGGVLAYTNLTTAVTSWSAGGAAQVRYGTPTNGWNGGILMKPGVYHEPTNVTINLPMTIVGEGGRNAVKIILDNTAARFIDVFNTSSNRTTSFVGITADDNGKCANSYGCVTMEGTASTIWYGNILDCSFNDPTGGCGSALYFVNIFTAGNICGNYFNSEVAGSSTVNLVATGSRPEDNATAAAHFDGNSISGGASIGLTIGGAGSAWMIANNTVRGNFATVAVDVLGDINSMDVYSGNNIYNATAGKPGIRSNGACWAALNGNLVYSGGPALTNIQNFQVTGGRYIAFSAGNNAVNLGGNGCSFNGVTVVGNGTGLAIQGAQKNLAFSNNQLRMPTGDVQGSSVSPGITNLCTAFTSLAAVPNAELPSATAQ